MIEKVIQRVWAGICARAPQLKRRAAAVPASWSLAVGVLLLVGGRLVWVAGCRPAHRQEIAAAYGSASVFYGGAQANRDGSRFTYVATASQGFAVFLCDAGTGHKQIVYQEKGGGLGASCYLTARPWSPDDNYFVYTRGATIAICQGDTGGVLASFDCGNRVDGLTWLTPDTFAFARPAGDLHLVHRQQNGKWQRLEAAGVKVSSSAFTALSSNTIAWRGPEGILAMDLDSKAVTPVYRPPPGHTIETFAWSQDPGRWLLRLRRGSDASYSLWQLAPGDAPSKVLPTQPGSLDRTRLFTHSGTLSASLDGGKLFAVGIVSNEPAAGIWQYDLASGQVRSVVPGSDHPSPYAGNVTPFQSSIKLPSGRRVDCTIYPPAKFDRHRKYPLVLGYTMFGVAVNGAHGRLWVPGVANCGAFVVIVNRREWVAGIEQWGEVVMGAYESLLLSPRIDKDGVFLFGASAETQYMTECVTRHPGLWKGVILLNPTGLPDFSESPPFQSRPRILLSSGGEEKADDRLKKYQAEALKCGVMVEMVIHPGEGHHLAGNAAQLERTRAMVRFIFEE